jgi:hypothetical protein
MSGCLGLNGYGGPWIAGRDDQTTCLAFTCFLIAAIWLAVSPRPSLLG